MRYLLAIFGPLLVRPTPARYPVVIQHLAGPNPHGYPTTY